ncbi:MAG TPA: class I SAM-dependent methyltransferase [Candidatus Limnocylindrales bacterium]
MTDVFGAGYSDSYDALYADKDYGAECDLVEGILHRSGRPVHSLLDLGCGTGRHSVELARRGYEIVGVDISEGMLERARRRATAEGAKGTTFLLGDIQNVQLDRQFDSVLSMFAVVGYQISDEAVRSTLANVRRHLAPGGVFIFDVWYGPAVIAVGPSERTKTVTTEFGQIDRKALGQLEPGLPVCTVKYELTSRRAGQPDATLSETHRMRYFFDEELENLLAEAGLTLKSLTAFPDVENPPSVDSWNVLAVAQG